MFRARMTLFYMGAVCLLVGILEPFTNRPVDPYSPLGLIQVLLLAVLGYVWCRADAAERGIVPPKGAAIMIAVFAIVGIPAYFARSRPWRAAVWASFKALGFLVLIQLLYIFGRGVGHVLHT